MPGQSCARLGCAMSCPSKFRAAWRRSATRPIVAESPGAAARRRPSVTRAVHNLAPKPRQARADWCAADVLAAASYAIAVDNGRRLAELVAIRHREPERQQRGLGAWPSLGQ